MKKQKRGDNRSKGQKQYSKEKEETKRCVCKHFV